MNAWEGIYDSEFRKLALEKYPEEAVAAIYNERFVPLVNVAEDPKTDFKIEEGMAQSMQVSGGLHGLMHSHPEGHLHPSQRDMAQQEASGIPWGICTVQKDSVSPVLWFGDQTPMAPLVGREFIHGVHDCYSLVRDFYRSRLDIVLPLFPREYQWWEQEGQNMLEEGIQQAGFVNISIDDIRPYDGVMGKVVGKVSNHCGVYLGNGLFLHHLMGRASRKEPLHPWRKLITRVVRHKDL